jgi:hypothetical protein
MLLPQGGISMVVRGPPRGDVLTSRIAIFGYPCSEWNASRTFTAIIPKLAISIPETL